MQNDALTKNEVLKRFAVRVREWLAAMPARAGEIRGRICERLKLKDVEFDAWIGISKPAIAAASTITASVDEKKKSQKAASLKWLKRRYPKLMAKARNASGTERDRLLEKMMTEIAANVSHVSVLTRDRVRNEICDKTDGLGVSKSAFDAAMRAAKKSAEESKGDGREGDEGDWLRLAQRFKDELWNAADGRAIARWQSEWYEWRARFGCYKRVSKDMMLAESVRWLADKNLVVTTAIAANFLQALTALCVIDDAFCPPCWIGEVDGVNAAAIYVALQNGILDVDSVKFEMGDVITHAPLIEHTPQWFSLNVLPYNFDIAATCPLVDRAVTRWQPVGVDDPDGLGARLLQDWAGYTFWPGQPLQTFLLNIGEGNDGKSQYMQIIEALVGMDNAAAVDLDGFDPKNQFGLWPLLGKTLNTVFDATYVERVTTGRLKQVTAGDRITVARKNLPSITAVLGAKIQISCNELPGFSDRSDATWRRMMILQWRPIPAGDVVIDFAKRVISMEMPGVFLWALRGFKRVRQCGFIRAGLVEKNVKEAKEQIQHEFGFFEERLSVVNQEPANKVYTEDLMEVYKLHCKAHNVKASCYPEAIGKSLRRWVRGKLLETGWDGAQIDDFLKRENFIRREGSGVRREYYIGLYLARSMSEVSP